MGPCIRNKNNEVCLRIWPGWMNSANVIIEMKNIRYYFVNCAV